MRFLPLIVVAAVVLGGCAGTADPTVGTQPPAVIASDPPRTSSAADTTESAVPTTDSTGATDSTAPTDPTETRTFSNTVLPTLTRPTAPPSAPSDQLTGVWVLGTVASLGEGTCATLTADDGRTLTLSGTVATPLTAGDRVRVRIVMTESPVYCGDVEAWTLLEVKTAV